MKYYQPQHHHKIQISQTLGVSKKSPTLAKSQFLLQRKTNQNNFMAQTSLTPRTGVHVTMFNRQPNIEIFIFPLKIIEFPFKHGILRCAFPRFPSRFSHLASVEDQGSICVGESSLTAFGQNRSQICA